MGIDQTGLIIQNRAEPGMQKRERRESQRTTDGQQARTRQHRRLARQAREPPSEREKRKGGKREGREYCRDS